MKTIDEIFGEMLSCLEEQTGLEPEPGCDLSVRMYAVAAQVYALYIQAQWGHPPGLSPDGGERLSGSPRSAAGTYPQAGHPGTGLHPFYCPEL